MITKDLIVLAADKDTEYAVRGLLGRSHSVGIRPVQYDVFVHPEHDPACRLRAQIFLRPFVDQYGCALVVFDREGSGRDAGTRLELEREVEQSLNRAGWRDRAAAIVIDPELEAWVWSDSPHVRKALGWADRSDDLFAWLQSNGFAIAHDRKPLRPKEAMRAVLRSVQKPPSAAIFEELAQTVSFTRCTDAAFVKLLDTLRRWFPERPSA